MRRAAQFCMRLKIINKNSILLIFHATKTMYRGSRQTRKERIAIVKASKNEWGDHFHFSRFSVWWPSVRTFEVRRYKTDRYATGLWGDLMHSPSLDSTVWYGDQIYLAFASRRYSILTFNTEVTACVGKTQTPTDLTERFLTGLQQAWRLEWSLWRSWAPRP